MEIFSDEYGSVKIPKEHHQENLKIFESSHVMSLLIYLRERGPSAKMDIYSAVSRNPKMPERMRTLESMGILRIEEGGKTTVSLTETGEEVADHLVAVMSLVD